MEGGKGRQIKTTMKSSEEKLLAGLILTILFAVGCINPAMFKKGAYAIDDWETWTGWNDAYGSHEVAPDGLYYRLTLRQDDTRDTSSDGYSPGLILSREITGLEWRADLQADFKIPPGQTKRFSCGVWLGDESTRPSLGSAAVLKLLAQRRNGPRPGDDTLIIFYIPAGEAIKIPKAAKTLRFERNGNFFTVSYSLGKKEFKPVLRLEAPAAVNIKAQKFFIGGRADGDPQGAYARFTSLKINSRETLR